MSSPRRRPRQSSQQPGPHLRPALTPSAAGGEAFAPLLEITLRKCRLPVPEDRGGRGRTAHSPRSGVSRDASKQEGWWAAPPSSSKASLALPSSRPRRCWLSPHGGPRSHPAPAARERPQVPGPPPGEAQRAEEHGTPPPLSGLTVLHVTSDFPLAGKPKANQTKPAHLHPPPAPTPALHPARKPIRIYGEPTGVQTRLMLLGACTAPRCREGLGDRRQAPSGGKTRHSTAACRRARLPPRPAPREPMCSSAGRTEPPGAGAGGPGIPANRVSEAQPQNQRASPARGPPPASQFCY